MQHYKLCGLILILILMGIVRGGAVHGVRHFLSILIQQNTFIWIITAPENPDGRLFDRCNVIPKQQ
jgi:hypothetical protein